MCLSLRRAGLVLSTALAIPLLIASPGLAQPADSAVLAEMDALFREGDAARIDAELFPRMRELLAMLDPAKGDVLVERLMDVKGMLGDGPAQDELAALYEKRARDAHGDNSEPHLAARIRGAFSLMQAGRFDEGYGRLREALAASARTDHHAFTIEQYREAANRFHANGMNEEAGALFADERRRRPRGPTSGSWRTSTSPTRSSARRSSIRSSISCRSTTPPFIFTCAITAKNRAS